MLNNSTDYFVNARDIVHRKKKAKAIKNVIAVLKNLLKTGHTV